MNYLTIELVYKHINYSQNANPSKLEFNLHLSNLPNELRNKYQELFL